MPKPLTPDGVKVVAANDAEILRAAMLAIHARNPRAFDVIARRWRQPITDDVFHSADEALAESRGGE